MNVKTIRKQYDKLTALERTALLLAANARGDEPEIRALFESATADTYRLRHHFGAMDTLTHLALLAMARRLDTALLFFEMLNRADDADAWDAARIAAYVFCVETDAWTLFCRGLGVDENAVRASCVPVPMLEYAEKIVRRYCPSQAQVVELLQKEKGADARAITAEQEAAQWRAGFDDLVKRWE